MKLTRLAPILLGCIVSLQSALAYSPIWNVDSWNAARLTEAGISVVPWKNDQIGEDPPLTWVRVTYDSSKLPEDQGVLMTLWVTASNGQTVCTCRAARTQGDAKQLTIIFAVRDENIANSRVEILALKSLAVAASRDHGNPGFGGYSLRAGRIMELARQTSANRVPVTD